jgi:hypothetical protein
MCVVTQVIKSIAKNDPGHETQISTLKSKWDEILLTHQADQASGAQQTPCMAFARWLNITDFQAQLDKNGIAPEEINLTPFEEKAVKIETAKTLARAVGNWNSTYTCVQGKGIEIPETAMDALLEMNLSAKDADTTIDALREAIIRELQPNINDVKKQFANHTSPPVNQAIYLVAKINRYNFKANELQFTQSQFDKLMKIDVEHGRDRQRISDF